MNRDPQLPPQLRMVAGEASGDLLAALLLQGIKARWPQAQAQGVGGPKMQEQGFVAWAPSDRLAVHGLVEVIKVYRELSRFRDQLGERIIQERPDVFIGVDAPDFNFELERRIRQSGIKTIHFVSPSLWAWRGGRIKKIKACVDHMLCLFPFEPEIYHREGIAATYVGHPLADVIPMHPDRVAARQSLGLSLDRPVVALLPGSRRGEVEHLTPRFLQAAALMSQQRPEVQWILPCAPGRRARIEALVAQHAPSLTISLTDGQSHPVLAACDVTMIASGTATLEAALYKRPMVVAYAQHPVSHFLMKRMAYLPWVSLPNILLKEFAVPELIQNDATPSRLAAATLAYLDQPASVSALEKKFTELHHLLQKDTARCAAEVVAHVLQG